MKSAEKYILDRRILLYATNESIKETSKVINYCPVLDGNGAVEISLRIPANLNRALRIRFQLSRRKDSAWNTECTI
jgi:hypothetical protein